MVKEEKLAELFKTTPLLLAILYIDVFHFNMQYNEILQSW